MKEANGVKCSSTFEVKYNLKKLSLSVGLVLFAN